MSVNCLKRMNKICYYQQETKILFIHSRLTFASSKKLIYVYRKKNLHSISQRFRFNVESFISSSVFKIIPSHISLSFIQENRAANMNGGRIVNARWKS